MKASLKFREDQKPLIRAKLPLSILGLPFQSGVVAGETKELSLNLSTFFESGPSIKICYRPNDTWNPFSLVVKTGTGPFGSPVSSSMLMSAEFNLLGKGNPSFMLHFKPQFGDFSIKKSQSSSVLEKEIRALGKVVGPDKEEEEEDESIEVVDVPDSGGVRSRFCGRKITVSPPSTASVVAGVLSGVEVTARTKLPVRSRAMMNFRWGLRFPAEVGDDDSVGGVNFRRIPFLVMNKIGIEHVIDEDLKSKGSAVVVAKGLPELGNNDVGDVCLMLKRQLEVLQSENGMLRKAVEDLRFDVCAGKVASPMPVLGAGDWNPGRFREVDRSGVNNGNGGKMERRSGEKKLEGDVNEELKKKAFKGATTGGGGIGA